MTIAQDITKTELPPRIILYEIDLSYTNVAELQGILYRFTPMTSGENPVIFGNEEYMPFPIEISGIEFNSDEAPARPQITISNVSKLFGALSFLYGDLVGTRVKYIETFSTYLNSANTFSLPPATFFISKKINHTKTIISYELRSPHDKERAFLPKRQMLRKDFPGLGTNKNVT